MVKGDDNAKIQIEPEVKLISNHGLKAKDFNGPLKAFPLLKEAAEAQRAAYKIVLRGTALRWEELDEDIYI